MQILETEVASLRSQLDQARAATDLQLVRDMLNRAGMSYTERTPDGLNVIIITHPQHGVVYMTFTEAGSLGHVNP